MDFTYSDEQQAIAELSYRILSEQLPPEVLRDLERSGEWFADDVWLALAKADLLGIALPEADGGGGYGLIEACVIAQQIGRTVAPVPYLATIVAAAMPLAHFGSDEQRKRFLPSVIDGSVTLSFALYEPEDVDVPVLPATRAMPEGSGWRLDGEKSLVVGANRAAVMLVPARTGETTSAVFLVDPQAAGVSLQRETAVTGEPQWGVQLDGVLVDADDRLGEADQGKQIVDWTSARWAAAICATQTGVCEEALAITAKYVSEREQFGSKLGTFQAVGQRVADAYIDTEAIRLTAIQAIWRLSEGLEADDELMTAKFWAADGGQRVVHAAQHLHGGIGVDLDYPIHRYFRWAKVLELTLGGATASLQRLGMNLAAHPVAGS
ncbi:MAG: acyl-CoA dehydrogenase [Acidimicrobiia bacterium]|nr:acyl-CoA dehydrogenase [Acidimicrobiia bacterium]